MIKATYQIGRDTITQALCRKKTVEKEQRKKGFLVCLILPLFTDADAVSTILLSSYIMKGVLWSAGTNLKKKKKKRDRISYYSLYKRSWKDTLSVMYCKVNG